MSTPVKPGSRTKQIISSKQKSSNKQFQSIELGRDSLADQYNYSINYETKKVPRSLGKSLSRVNAILQDDILEADVHSGYHQNDIHARNFQKDPLQVDVHSKYHPKETLQVDVGSKYLQRDILQADVCPRYAKKNQHIVIQDEQTNTHVIEKVSKNLKSSKNSAIQSPYIELKKVISTKKKQFIEDSIPIDDQSPAIQRDFQDPFLSRNHISDQLISQYKKSQEESYKRVIARNQIICSNCGGPHYRSRCPYRDQKEIQNEANTKCFNCKGLGHTAKYCPQPAQCFYCKQTGHYGRDCKSSQAQRARRTCLNCHKVGHYARQCTKPVKCHRCFHIGHIMSNCPQNAENKREATSCYNCKKMGHYVKECPQQPSCHTCGGLNHFSNECPKNPRQRSVEAEKISKISKVNQRINKSKSQVNISSKKVLKLSQSIDTPEQKPDKPRTKGSKQTNLSKFRPMIEDDANGKLGKGGDKNSKR